MSDFLFGDDSAFFPSNTFEKIDLWNKNIARGTTDPGYRVYNLSYLSS